jgi:hypothetical protein
MKFELPAQHFFLWKSHNYNLNAICEGFEECRSIIVLLKVGVIVD